MEPAGGERKEAWRNLLKGLVERGLRGVRLVISDDHPSIRQAVMAELPGASWQRCVVHFMRNVLAHVPQSERGVVAEELQEVFVARRRGTAESLARGFVERYRDRFKRAVEVFAQGLAAFPSGKHGEEALTYLDFPSGHQRHIKSTNVLERLIREVKRRTRVVGVFPGEGSLVNLATVVILRATAAFPSGKHGEDWAFRRYLDMDPLWAVEEKPTKIAT
jgi:putative transposase